MICGFVCKTTNRKLRGINKNFIIFLKINCNLNFYTNVFSYDCRVFLQDLSEKTIGLASNENNNEFTDQIEEELCESERYKDLKNQPKEPVEVDEKRGKGVEIGFSYDDNNEADDGLSESSDEEENEPYQAPKEVKLPTGINLVKFFKKL